MKNLVSYARRSKGEVPRARTTFALHAENFDYICSVASRKCLSMNAALNFILAELRQARSEKQQHG